MNKYLSRVTSSSRGENFHPLVWPFLISTLAYGVGFVIFGSTSIPANSSLFIAMTNIYPWVPFVWGLVAIATIVVGLTFLLFNIPPAGRISGLTGFMVWVFASFAWVFDGTWLLLLSVGLPNLWFWIWQYFSLSHFRREEMLDKQTMVAYDSGQYDDDNGGRNLRETNRGRDAQSHGSYDSPDNGIDKSRPN